MQKIVPNLWYDKEAREAAEFYISIFDNATFIGSTILPDTPGGDSEFVVFQLEGIRFEAISGGPLFKFNPSVSLMVSCTSKEEVNLLWQALSDGGTALMPLDSYPFSKWYGWIQDRYGLSWQIMYVEDKPSQKIIPALLFSEAVCGKAEEAMNHYTEIIKNSKIIKVDHYKKGEAKSGKANVKFGEFQLAGMNFIAMDHGLGGDFTFDEAFSFLITCETQEEIDYYWKALSAKPEYEQCGWLKDKFGFSWQIGSSRMNDMLMKGSPDQIKRVTKALLEMKKIDLGILEKEYSKK